MQPMGQEAQSAEIEHERLASLINSMGDGVLAVDELQKIVMYNGASLNILDINGSIKGKSLSSVINVVDKNNQPIDIRQLVMKTKTPTFNRDYRLLYQDKSTISLYLSIAPVRLGFGKTGTQGHVILLRDITREKSLEEERDEFISVISHELRTPIAISEGNISNAQLVAEKGGDITQIKDALQQAHDQILFLSGLINDLSTLSRAERGKLSVEIEAINVNELIKGLAGLYETSADQKGLKLQVELDPRLELLRSSQLYVREVLQNFVTNAIKYTEKGSVTISAKQVSNGVEFAVQDTGIGISKGDKERVFDKFFRSEDFRTRENNGTGLGLYVSMKLARLINAEITIDSELNKGTTFKIVIPNLK